MDKPLIVGYVTTELSSRNGWGRYSRSLAEAVGQLHTVRVLTERRAPNDTTLTDVRAILPSATFGPASQFGIFFAALRNLRECSIVHCLVEPVTPAVALACFFLRVPVVMTMHGTYSVPPERFSLKQLEMRFMYARLARATTGSLYTEQKVREIVSFAPCDFIPNGVNLERFYPLPGVEKKPLLLTVGALKPRKGADVVIRSLALLKDEFPLLRYAIVGSDDSKSFAANLHSLCEELGVSDRVEFLSTISDDDLVKLYNQARVFVLAARNAEGSFEGFPMVFYEANACGTPVITTEGFGSEYAIHNGENGFVVAPDDPSAVAEKIRMLLSDETRYRSMSTHATHEAGEHTWDKIAQKLEAFYRRAMA